MAKHYGTAHQSARCTVCHHPSRPEIDRALIDAVPYRTLAATYGVSPSALCRHIKHLQHQMVVQERRTEQSQISQFLEKLELLEVRLDRLFRKAEDSRSLNVSLGCLQESIRVLALQEKVRHTLGKRL
ncbi:MAG: hypothetical protein WC600_03700 [Desulfobaccales bacterium]